jgi:murein DD-endopeptidase MepM/ murein hydrolase activator NlpD
MSLSPSIPAQIRLLPARVFPRLPTPKPSGSRIQHIREVIEPQRIAALQLAGFLTLSLTWLVPSPTLGNQLTWSSPVIGSGLVNSYLAPDTTYGSGHRGVDYQVTLGQGVFAPADATVSFVGKVVDRQVLSLSHEGKVISSYEPVCSSLAIGQEVAAGDLVAEVCEAEEDYAQHCLDNLCLHFSTRQDGEYLSPLWFTGELTPSVLLPWIEPG